MKKWIPAALLFITVLCSTGCSLAGNQTFTSVPHHSDNSGDPDDTTDPDGTQAKADLDYIFDLTALPVITITISSNEWNKLLAYFDLNKRNETCVLAQSFAFDKNGVVDVESNVGLRIRGNSFSRSRPELDTLHNPASPSYDHAHFRIDFTYTADTNRFRYLRSLNMKWFRDDQAYCREVYNYDLFRLNGVWTAPRASYARLYIKIAEDPSAANFGVYEIIEPVDRSFLRTRFDSSEKNGYLWKCLWQNNGEADMDSPIANNKIGLEWICLSNESDSFRPSYDLKTYDENFYSNKYTAFTNYAAGQLRTFASRLNTYTGATFVNWITNAMDVDLFLKTYAVSVAVGMWDDYWANANNYYFYFDNSGKAYFIPYDYDNSLGISGVVGDPGTQSFLDWSGSGLANARPLIAKILGVPEFMTKYKSYVERLINPTNHLFDFVSSTNRIVTWQNMVSPYVDNDTGVYTTVADFNADGYYLLSGSDTDNYFRTRIKTACANLGLNYSLYDDGNEDPSGGGGGTSSDPLASDTTTYSSMYIRGVITGGWNTCIAMISIGDSLWSNTINVSTAGEYKFSDATDWTHEDWGEGNYTGDGVAVMSDYNNLSCSYAGNVTFIFNDNTYQYWVTQ